MKKIKQIKLTLDMETFLLLVKACKNLQAVSEVGAGKSNWSGFKKAARVLWANEHLLVALDLEDKDK